MSTVVRLAKQDEVLGALFPFTSMNRLCFSRCTGYPYTSDIPLIQAALDGTYQVRLPDNTLLGGGNAIEVISLLKQNLPANIQPAVPGTADDL
ncbi:hypothetical protein BC343_15585 [Mucilaginibacter pedocola]|uniref:Uncharacterized protein n=1 Tax=Mucilaginibacter pedocola TaxID=1792845 RepID=A0A1S9P8B4_9SPHI|nr:hypothetical protein BC343_15585 [Mucilaginibacter pedocola]